MDEANSINQPEATVTLNISADQIAGVESPAVVSDNLINPAAPLPPLPTPTESTYAEIELGKFDREKLIEEYIYHNIHELWQNIFHEKITSIERQKAEIVGSIDLQNGNHIPRRGVRLDLFLICESGNTYIVEIKNPKAGKYDTIDAIGKVLFYATKFPQANRLVILSTVYDEGFLETIQKYQLPIDFVLFTHDKAYLLKK